MSTVTSGRDVVVVGRGGVAKLSEERMDVVGEVTKQLNERILGSHASQRID